MSFPLHPAISLVVNHRACSSEGGRRRKEGGRGWWRGKQSRISPGLSPEIDFYTTARAPVKRARVGGAEWKKRFICPQ